MSVSYRDSKTNPIYIIVNDCAVAADILFEVVANARRKPQLDVVDQREVGAIILVIAAGERSDVLIRVTFVAPAQSGDQFAVGREDPVESDTDDIAGKRLTGGLD